MSLDIYNPNPTLKTQIATPTLLVILTTDILVIFPMLNFVFVYNKKACNL